MTPGIAVLGAACRFPDAASPAALWQTVLAGRRAFRRLPAERLRLEDYAADPSDVDGTYLREAAVLEGYTFDRVAFHVSGDGFRSADLAHWLALDVAGEALRDAGFPDGVGLPRERTGVLLGNTLTGEFSRANLMRLRWPYVRRVVDAALGENKWPARRRRAFLNALEQRYKSPFAPPTADTLAGGLSNTIAGRICNHFDLGGGGYTLDAACASSLLAVARACSALEANEIDAAIIGGVDLSLDPFELVGFARAGAMAHDDMRIFDKSPTGFLPGEGCGFVVLARDADATADRRQRLAVIRGWGVSSDGGGGLTRPEAHGQLLALRRAYERAAIDIGSVAYFEAHGTGTAIGDATELRALSQARSASGNAGVPAALGSVKANIGHTKAAAGIAGLIKATMALRAQILPPTTGCDSPHAELSAATAPLRVLGRGERWPRDMPLRAGVSAMGFGGINVHVVLEAAAVPRRRALTSRERALLSSPQDAELFPIAAAGFDALARAAERLADRAPSLAHCELSDLSAALIRGATSAAPVPAAVRGAVIASTPAQLADRLARLANRAQHAAVGVNLSEGVCLGCGAEVPRVGLLFPGQGAACDSGGGALRTRYPEVEALYRSAALRSDGDPVATEVAQPAIVTASLAALRVLATLGIAAEVVVGHSLGELVALHWGGVLGEEAVLRIAHVRGRAMADLAAGGGSMLAVGASEADVRDLLHGQAVAIAGVNAIRQTVISGDAAGVARVAAHARERGWTTRHLATSHAFHSPLVAPAEVPLRAHLQSEELLPLVKRIGSTVLGRVLEKDDDLRELLCRQVTAPVRFLDAMSAVGGGIGLWIEAGPGRVLAGLLEGQSAANIVSLDAGAGSLAGLLEVAAVAYVLGVPVKLQTLFEHRFVRPFDVARRPSFLTSPCELAPLPARHAPAVRAPAVRSVSGGIAPPAIAVGRDGNGPRPIDVVRRLIAARAELPIDAVRADQLLLRDLHLNSITVAQIASDAARELSLAPSAAPTEFSAASVHDLARALRERLRIEGEHDAGSDAARRTPDGVAPWVRPFTMALVERPLLPRRAAPTGGEWTMFGRQDHPLAAALTQALPSVGGVGVVVLLPEQPNENDVPALLAGARALLDLSAPRHALFVQRGGGASAFARTLHLEAPDATVCVVDVPLSQRAPDVARLVVAELAASIAAGHGFVEAHYDERLRRREPVLRPIVLDDQQHGTSLTGNDVVLVSGGAKGITAECVLALGHGTGARFALIGRSPATNAEVMVALDRLATAGIHARYLTADVADAQAVAGAVREIETRLGPITAVIHAAGINEPRLLATLDDQEVLRTLAPKLGGLRNIVAAVSPARLRLLVTFGSTIGRSGLRGAASYALANDWTAAFTERFQRDHPRCRCVALEWSIWAGAGMGTNLGQLGTMAREGVTAVTVPLGVDMLARAVRFALPAVRIVVTGRYGDPPLLPFELSELPVLRFIERARVHYPGVELVVDAELSAQSDPYLADHIFGGERLLPAVIGLEAMAQAAIAVTGKTTAPSFEKVELARPIVVPPVAPLIVRIAALVRESGDVDIVVRSAETAFKIDHFRARCTFVAPSRTEPLTAEGQDVWPACTGERPHAAPEDVEPTRINEQDDAAPLYADILFQSGRFRRLESYRRLHARECVALISPAAGEPWFGPYHSRALVLGDPGARDAALHAIQACVPQLTLLPAGVDRIVSHGLGEREPLVVHARERWREGDLFTYDMDILDAAGDVRERWEGLRLRAVRGLSRPPRTTALLAPYLERRMAELAPGSAVTARVRTNGGSNGGSNGGVRSHAGSLTLSVAAPGTVACDVEPVRQRSVRAWRDLLTASRFDLMQVVCRAAAEPRARAATRIWSAGECLTKAGVPPGAPLTLAGVADDGWIQFRCGNVTVATYVAELRGEARPLCFALLVPAT